ncbi:hypothetical protein XENTR_v10020897 [Xenopus tropicalis]|nr:hypothetical protein XENTR_v10020897 [Xenopus tropicalis]
MWRKQELCSDCRNSKRTIYHLAKIVNSRGVLSHHKSKSKYESWGEKKHKLCFFFFTKQMLSHKTYCETRHCVVSKKVKPIVIVVYTFCVLLQLNSSLCFL